MKNIITKLLRSPGVAIGGAVVIAAAIGITSTVIHNNNLAQRFTESAKLGVVTTTDIISSSSKHLTLAFPVGGRIKTVSVNIGDNVKAGTVLASLDDENAIGAINQAKAAYDVAQTAYNKLINGASTPDIAVTQASVDSATTALNNAKQNLIRDIATAEASVNSAVLSNTNNLFSNPQTDSPKFGISGTVQTNQQLVSNINSERVDVNSALYAWQKEIASINEDNSGQAVKDSSTYITVVRNYLSDILTALSSYTQVTAGGSQAAITADQTAVASAKTSVDSAYVTITNDLQAVRTAQAALDQAKANLALKQSPARAEDIEIAKAQVESTQGALQIAQGAYNNTLITAPVNGIVTNITITAGQIISANTPAIELLSQ